MRGGATNDTHYAAPMTETRALAAKGWLTRIAATQAKHATHRSKAMRHEARAKRLRHTHLKNETKLTPNA